MDNPLSSSATSLKISVNDPVNCSLLKVTSIAQYDEMLGESKGLEDSRMLGYASSKPPAKCGLVKTRSHRCSAVQPIVG